MSKRQMKLGAFLMSPGHHPASWRHPSACADLGANFREYARLARIAEAARFDLIFLDDTVAVKDTSQKTGTKISRSAFFEPITLLAGMAAVTERIGLVGTVSSTFNEPYNLARKFASLDLISHGRAGWNVVTSNNEEEAANFTAEPHLDHDKRYERAEEYVDIIVGLWNSFEDDAFLYDKESGIYLDYDKMHILNHRGRHYSVRGPLNVARSPQGHPVIFQAGASEAGRELAARTAEVVFTAQNAREDAIAFYSDMKGRLARHGRRESDMLIMPGILPVVGRTKAEAEDRYAELQELIDLDVAIAQLSQMIGNFDLSVYPPHGPVPVGDIPVTKGNQSRQQLLLAMAQRENLSIAELARRTAGGRGHWVIIGSPQEIADQMEDRFLNGSADGFNVLPDTLPGGLEDFGALVIPELQRRGLVRREYEGTTLREHLGLPHPKRGTA
jgi:FMN-dependent oxidoreductase (nitrilotriacetate monooxygenase family)